MPEVAKEALRDRWDPEVASVMDDHPVRASKEYECVICGEAIFKTQRHRRVVWRSRDTARVLHTDHVHMRCYP